MKSKKKKNALNRDKHVAKVNNVLKLDIKLMENLFILIPSKSFMEVKQEMFSSLFYYIIKYIFFNVLFLEFITYFYDL